MLASRCRLEAYPEFRLIEVQGKPPFKSGGCLAWSQAFKRRVTEG